MSIKLVRRIAKEILNKDIEKEIISFFEKNQNPSDAVLHKWAEKNGFDVHKVEEIVYKLASKYVLFLTGGRSNEKGASEKDVNKKELAMGIKVESEHIDDLETQKRIAIDHLSEISDYYTRLKKMESEAGIKD